MRPFGKPFQKTVSILLALLMLCSLLPLSSFAASSVSYVYRSWNEIRKEVVSETRSCSDYTLLSDQSSNTLSSGWYVVDRDLTINDRLRVSGEVHLILCDDKTLTLKAGITVLDGDTLKIYGQSEDKGKLYSHPEDGKGALEDHAVIGGTEDDPDAGDIIIYGGTVDLDAPDDLFLDFDNDAACLGGGPEGAPNSIQIFGGTVKASAAGHCGGAAIGGGEYGAPSHGAGILIYGGVVEANARIGDGAAIGGGYDSPHASGTIRIYGGKIDAHYCDGAGIGSGAKTDSNSIVISGGFISAYNTASGSDGAAIGSGKGGRAHPITISNATIVAVGGYGAGIGSGCGGPANSIHISDSNITATSLYGGAGIGGGDKGDCEEIIIENSSVAAESENHKDAKEWIAAFDSMIKTMPFKPYDYYNPESVGPASAMDCTKAAVTLIGSLISLASTTSSGAAIGGGDGGSVGSIRISNCYVKASAGNCAAAIGSGDEASRCGTITIENCSYVKATSGTDGAAIGGGNECGVDSITISGCETVIAENDGYAAAIGGGDEASCGTITISDCHSVSAESGDYGAAIGSGDEAERGCTINISNSTVTASAGTDAAGIGTGNETDGTATITITDSAVTAHGGRYAAGIGGGDDVSGGSITITNSTIYESDSKTDGAGIGGGESGNGGTITITNSTVTAHGGGYGAGIGGGDAGSGGTISISGSTVRAYGGTDAAGIGGGEGGEGGTILIYNSDVYAKGKEYGAGIGGGEDCGVSLVQIWGSQTNVVAVAGGDGNAVAVGNGDYNSFFYSCPDVSVSLGGNLKVKAGSSSGSASVYTEKSRYAALWDNEYGKVYYCEHDHTIWRSYTAYDHTLYCADCGAKLTEKGYHTWDDRDICTTCGVVRRQMTLTFVERDQNNQEVRTTQTVYAAEDYALPSCAYVPDGYGFLSWKVDYGDGFFYFHAPGDMLVPQSYGPEIEAVYIPLKQTTYIDENGRETTVMAKRISALPSMEYLLVLTEGWYVVDAQLQTRSQIRIQGDVRWIVEDGCSLRVKDLANFDNDDSIWYDSKDYSTFSLYGQRNQTGVLDAGHYEGDARFSTFSQYGATFQAKSASFDKSGTVYAGTFDIFSDTVTDYGNIRILGGNVNLARLGWNENVGMELGWTRRSDRIKLANFVDRGPIWIKDGQAFVDDNGTIYRDQITTAQQEALSADSNDKTLRPYLEHDYYDNPEWAWDDEYTDATAVFRCKDCDHTEEIKAKVTWTDSGKNRTSTARCTFFGDEYTATQTKQVIFDVTLAGLAHGSLTANKQAARKGENIKLTVTPNEGYLLTRLYYTDASGAETEIDGSAFPMPEGNVTVRAELKELHEVSYLDESGSEQTVWALPVTNDTTELSEGWHCVEGNVSFDHRQISLHGDVKLILCDGAIMTMDSYSDLGNWLATADTSLSIYRAPGETVGILDADDICVEDFRLFGGEVRSSGTVTSDKNLDVKGGTLTVDEISVYGDARLFGGVVHCTGNDSQVFYCSGDLRISDCTLTVPGGLTSVGDVFVSSGSVTVDGTFSNENLTVTGGNVTVNGTLQTDQTVTLGWTSLSDSIYAEAYDRAESIVILDGQELTDGQTVFSGSYDSSQRGLFAGKTLTPNFLEFVDRSEPYIDRHGAYIPGEVAHYALAGKNYAVNADGSMGQVLDSVELLYFEFALLADDTWQIKCYTGPMDGLTQLEIPKTFRGKAVTVVGESGQTFMNGTGEQSPFTLVLKESITTIENSAFVASKLTAVDGDTSGLCQIKETAFFWANLANGCALTLHLDYPGTITVASNALYGETVTARVKHATKLSSDGGASSISYVFTDAHPYDEPVWTWADDLSAATATFTCPDARCQHVETVNADVDCETTGGSITYTASVTLDGIPYTDSKDVTPRSVNIQVGGVGINANNYTDILGDGTARYDFVTNTLTLENADIEVTNGNGIRYNESAGKPFRIVLVGENRIADEAGDDSGTCYGIALYAAAPGFTIGGSGTLAIELASASPRVGIHARKALTVDGVAVAVDVTGSGNAVGVDLVYSDSILALSNAARMDVSADGVALQSNRNVQNLRVSDDSVFAAISDTQAFNDNIRLTDSHPTVKVNTDPSAEGSAAWDGTTALTSYKYIRLRGDNAPCTVTWKNGDTVLETDNGVPCGTTPVYDGATPTKAIDTATHTVYTFTGWSPVIGPLTDDVTYMAQFASYQYTGGKFVGHSLSLKGDIGVNFFVDETVDTANMRVLLSWGSEEDAKTQTYTFEGLTAEDGAYKFTAGVTAKQMNDTVTAILYVGDTVVDVSEYSVAQYACRILANTGGEFNDLFTGENAAEKLQKLQNLCRAMLLYGAKAQAQFGYNTDSLADADLGAYTLASVDLASLGSYGSADLTHSGLHFTSSCLVLKSKTSHMLYFDITDADALEDTTITCGSLTLERGTNSNGFYVIIPNMAAKNVLKNYTVTFTHKDGTVAKLTVNVGAYIKLVLDDTYTSAQLGLTEDQRNTLKNTVTALYWYSKAAEAYFES